MADFDVLCSDCGKQLDVDLKQIEEQLEKQVPLGEKRERVVWLVYWPIREQLNQGDIRWE